MQDIFFSIGCAMSKAGARDRAIEQAMRMLDIQEVAVDIRPRAWQDHARPQLVLINVSSPRRIMPVFFTPPEGTREHAVAQHNMQRLKDSKCKFNSEQQVREYLHARIVQDLAGKDL